MRAINGIVYSNLELNVMYLMQKRKIVLANDIVKHLRNVSIESVEYTLVVLEKYSTQLS